MPNAYISGTGGYVPPRVVTNDDLREQYGIDTTHEWIVQRTGIEERRYADEGVGSADLALPACKEALENAGIGPKDLDMIIFARSRRRFTSRAAASSSSASSGMLDGDNPKFVPALDIRNQCSGFLYGLGDGGVDGANRARASTCSSSARRRTPRRSTSRRAAAR